MASHSRVEDGETLREEGEEGGHSGERDGRGQGIEREREKER